MPDGKNHPARRQGPNTSFPMPARTILHNTRVKGLLTIDEEKSIYFTLEKGATMEPVCWSLWVFQTPDDPSSKTWIGQANLMQLSDASRPPDNVIHRAFLLGEEHVIEVNGDDEVLFVYGKDEKLIGEMHRVTTSEPHTEIPQTEESRQFAKEYWERRNRLNERADGV